VRLWKGWFPGAKSRFCTEEFTGPFSDHQLQAVLDLARATRVLGLEGGALVHDILGAGMTVVAAAAKRGLSAERERLYIGRSFRERLEILAKEFGYAN
jgi:hypothetical protein